MPTSGTSGPRDLVHGANRVLVLREYTSRDGSVKILPACTLPLTGRVCVQQIITDLTMVGVTRQD